MSLENHPMQFLADALEYLVKVENLDVWLKVQQQGDFSGLSYSDICFAPKRRHFVYERVNCIDFGKLFSIIDKLCEQRGITGWKEFYTKHGVTVILGADQQLFVEPTFSSDDGFLGVLRLVVKKSESRPIYIGKLVVSSTVQVTRAKKVADVLLLEFERPEDARNFSLNISTLDKNSIRVNRAVSDKKLNFEELNVSDWQPTELSNIGADSYYLTIDVRKIYDPSLLTAAFTWARNNNLDVQTSSTKITLRAVTSDECVHLLATLIEWATAERDKTRFPPFTISTGIKSNHHPSFDVYALILRIRNETRINLSFLTLNEELLTLIGNYQEGGHSKYEILEALVEDHGYQVLPNGGITK